MDSAGGVAAVTLPKLRRERTKRIDENMHSGVMTEAVLCSHITSYSDYENCHSRYVLLFKPWVDSRNIYKVATLYLLNLQTWVYTPFWVYLGDLVLRYIAIMVAVL